MDWISALNRVTYGVRQADLAAAKTQGWAAWVKQQLRPKKDAACEKRVKAISYTIEYEYKGKPRKRAFSLQKYFASPQELWDSVAGMDNPPEYLVRGPALETALVTWTKALHSRNQLLELLVEFWHNHFNVSINAQDEIALLLPVYDREVIRGHALGNFRQFLGAVAQSPCMLYYLDNAHSKASPANENYARELFELHTLGAMHYYNHLYDNQRDIPRSKAGIAEGYIDEDVYEAARAFTGWTVGDGRENEGSSFPENGAFHYHDQWHDPYQKHILGQSLKSYQGAMKDGLEVLDTLANHPGTAKHLCTKLCQWFVADEPPQSLVDKAVNTWLAHTQSADQIAQVIEVVLLSDEFVASLGSKMKRPNHLVFSLVRQLDIELAPSQEWIWLFEEMGYKQFAWATPPGHPDKADYWLNTDMLLKRWNTIPTLLFMNTEKGGGRMLSLQVEKLQPLTFDTIIDYWSDKLLGMPVSGEVRTGIRKVFSEDFGEMVNQDLSKVMDQYPNDFEFKLIQLVSLLAMHPRFHKR